MKVLQLGPYPPPHGGIQTHIVALREMLREHHIPCDVINLTRHRRESADGVYFPHSGFEVLSLLVQRRYDILHLHIGGRVWPRQLALGILCSVLPRRKSVLTFHSGGYPTSEEGRATSRRSFRARVFRRFNSIVAVNPEIASFFERVGVDPAKIKVISPHAFFAEQSAGTALPRQIESFLQAHQPVLITVGLLEKEYDLPLQISVLGRVRDKWPKAGLLIVGSGSLHGRLRDEISKEAYSEHILLYGDLEHSATIEAMRRSDLMLRTTWYDGDALSVREGLHLGIPVIATDNGMRPEGVHLIPARNLDALQAAIEEALGNPVRRQGKGDQAENGNLLAVLELYKELVG